jgi:hypothetical protein
MFLLKCWLSFLAHAIVNLGFRCFGCFCFSSIIVKNAEKVKKKKKPKRPKSKKTSFSVARRFLIFTLQKPLKTFGDKLKVASSTCHFHLNQNGTLYRNSLDMCVIGFQSRRKFGFFNFFLIIICKITGNN